MNRLLIALMVCITWAGATFGQTTVNLSVTDTPDNQTWNNGTWSVQLIPGPGNPDQTRSFTLLLGGGSLGSQSGSLSSTGTASMSLPANVNIGPVGTKWQFTVCSQQGTACSTSNVTVTTSSPQTVALTPSSIRVTASPNLPPIIVYTTTEISSASIGSQITVVGTTPSTPLLQSCTVVSGTTCTTWTGGGGVPTQFYAANLGAKFNGRSSVDGVLNSTTTVTSATLSCTSADVNKLIFTINGSGLAKANSTVASCSGAAFVMNATATATESGDKLVICSDDTAALQNAFTAALNGNGQLVLPAGLSCTTNVPFNLPNIVNPYPPQQAFVVKGQGLQATVIGITPATPVGSVGFFINQLPNTCTEFFNNQAPYNFSVVTAEDLSVTGFNYAFTGVGATNLFFNVCQTRRVGIFGFNNANINGWDATLAEESITDSNIQGVAGTAIAMSGGSSTASNNIIQGAAIGVLSVGGTNTVSDGLITTNTVDISATSSSSLLVKGTTIQTASAANVNGIKIDGTSTVTANGILLNPAGPVSALGVNVLAGGKFFPSNMRYIVASGTPTEISNAGSVFDGGNNDFTGTITNTGSWFGSASVTGTACATGNFALTSGWGTSSVASVAANGDLHGCHVTITGAAGAAGPVLTWTYPTAPPVAPPSCHLVGASGTLTGVAGGTPGATTVAFTFAGTPSAQTYVFDVGCP